MTFTLYATAAWTFYASGGHGLEWEVHDEQHDVELFDRQLDEKLHDIMLDEDEEGEFIEVLQDWMLPDEQLEP